MSQGRLVCNRQRDMNRYDWHKPGGEFAAVAGGWVDWGWGGRLEEGKNACGIPLRVLNCYVETVLRVVVEAL